MLLLTPYFDPALVKMDELAGIKDVDIDRLEGLFEGIYEGAGSRGYNASLTLESAHDPEGNVYREVQLQVTARFSRNGERFLSGGDMAVSLDGMLEATREGLSYALTLVS